MTDNLPSLLKKASATLAQPAVSARMTKSISSFSATTSNAKHTSGRFTLLHMLSPPTMRKRLSLCPMADARVPHRPTSAVEAVGVVPVYLVSGLEISEEGFVFEGEVRWWDVFETYGVL